MSNVCLIIFVTMKLSSLSLINFRNHLDADFLFPEDVAVFTGANGTGKTNILDAIHYLAFCKGFLNSVDSQNIHENEGFFLVEGKFSIEDKNHAFSCGLKRSQNKIFKKNGKEYDRLSEHIGHVPLVLIAPTDIQLISGGSEERRKFMDSVIAQFNRTYLEELIRYNKVLRNRNIVLRNGNPDAGMIEVLNMQLCEHAHLMFEERRQFSEELSSLLAYYYQHLSGGNELASVKYRSGLHSKNLEELLHQSFERDKVMQYTTEGLHKDDLELCIADKPLKRFASQGQQKSMLIALKLAQFDIISNKKKTTPLLLLDDIFEKLDQSRITALLELISKGHFGQIFITDTHPQRVTEILKSIDCAYTHFELPLQDKSRTSNEAD
jgi:DNA replication and repair protein RecF